MKKKLTALFLALALCLSLCSVAFAEDYYITVPKAFAGWWAGTYCDSSELDTTKAGIDKWYNEDGFGQAEWDATMASKLISGIRWQSQSDYAGKVGTDGKVSDSIVNEDNFYAILLCEDKDMKVDTQWVILVTDAMAKTNPTYTTDDIYLSGIFGQTGTNIDVIGHTVAVATATNGTITASPTNVASGTDVTVTTAPDAGYKTKSVSVTTDGGKSVNVTGSGNSYSFVMPNDNVTVSAVFEIAHTHTYDEAWSTDATNHWHAATCGHDTEKDSVGNHVDETVKDHKCDVCGYTMSECKDETGNDHKCDVCGKVLSECKDENGDSKCDICGKDMGKPIKPVTPAKPVIPVCPIIKSIVKTVAVAKTIAVVKTVAVVKTIKSILKWF